MGYLGRAIAAFLANRSDKIRLVAAFDVDLDKIGLSFSDVRCYSVRQMPEVLAEKRIDIAIVTKDAESLKKALVDDAPSPITYPTPKPESRRW